MTTALVVRMSRKELAGIDAAARKRSVTRSAFVRQLLRNGMSAEKPKKGVGWAEHFERLEKEGRRVKWKVVEEVLDASRKREFP